MNLKAYCFHYTTRNDQVAIKHFKKLTFKTQNYSRKMVVEMKQETLNEKLKLELENL